MFLPNYFGLSKLASQFKFKGELATSSIQIVRVILKMFIALRVQMLKTVQQAIFAASGNKNIV